MINTILEENYNVHADAKEPPSEALAQNTVVTGNLVSGGFLVGKKSRFIVNTFDLYRIITK